MSRSRRLAKGFKPRQDDRARGSAAPPSPVERIARLSPAKVLERISRARLQRDELDVELALLIDHAVSLRIGWPDIASAWVSAGRRPGSITNADTATAPAVKLTWPE